MTMENPNPSDQLTPEEAEMRNSFIFLDVTAKKLGGIAKLARPDQLEYLHLGLQTGFLTKEQVQTIAKQIGIHFDV